jgi:hypothetical protein
MAADFVIREGTRTQVKCVPRPHAPDWFSLNIKSLKTKKLTVEKAKTIILMTSI